MSLGATSVNQLYGTKVGTCPHGLPLGACPVCSGMAGGNSTTKRDIPRNAGEMTYNQCAAIGAMLMAQKHARQQAEQSQRNHLQLLATIQKSIDNAHQKTLDLAFLISNKLPSAVAKPINFVLTNIVARVLNIIRNTPNVITSFTQTITQKMADISDKLSAVYGELKSAVNEKISKRMSDFKKKIKSLFFIFGSQETDNDDDKKIDEAKRTFELKTFIHKLYKKLKGKDEKEMKYDENNSVQ